MSAWLSSVQVSKESEQNVVMHSASARSIVSYRRPDADFCKPLWTYSGTHRQKTHTIKKTFPRFLVSPFPFSRFQRPPPVRPSVRHTRANCDKTNESSADILTNSSSFSIQRMGGGERPVLPKIQGQTDPPSFKNGDFQSIFARIP